MASGNASQSTQASVQEYYGKVLKSTGDLQTNACTMKPGGIPPKVKEALALIDDEIKSRYYGCGLIIPPGLEGMKVLDLGCGSGQDCYILSYMVGEKGHVTGIDMTEEQLSIAQQYVVQQAAKFGYAEPNTKFVKGFIECLTDAGLQNNFYDIVVSNCVVNLSPDKKAVLASAYAVLKEGGEMYFSDVYADRELPEEFRENQALWGECIGGALHWRALYQIAEEVGFSTPLLVTASQIDIGNKKLSGMVGDARFASATFRLFKMPKNRPNGGPAAVIYEGSVAGSEANFILDQQTQFPKGEPVMVSGNVVAILKASRFCDDFTFSSKNVKACCVKEDAGMVDPFQVMSIRVGSAAAGACCPKIGSAPLRACCVVPSSPE